jgi:heat shock protein HslJ
MRSLLLALFAVALVSCQAGKTADLSAAGISETGNATQMDGHTSRTSLDWFGAYEGLMTCADCAGIHTRLTLGEDGKFELVERRLARGAEPTIARGPFGWESDGSIIVLETEAGPQRFAIGEGRLVKLEPGQSQPAWNEAAAKMAQVSPTWRDGRQTLGAVLQDHRWSLVDARAQGNQRIDALFPNAERAFTFTFEESRLHARGGCNGFRGSFGIDTNEMLTVTGGMSTMMACDPPLMEADATLSGLMAAPLETVLVRGAQPTLVLLTAAGDALVLTGELTPEARFGAPTRVFLEVAAQTVACEGSIRGDGQCLQVRELTFDEQGLRVGTPSEWRPFNAEIEGYQHEPGIRNVLRVKRFQPAAGTSDPAAPLYVLDLVVQSEVVGN